MKSTDSSKLIKYVGGSAIAWLGLFLYDIFKKKDNKSLTNDLFITKYESKNRSDHLQIQQYTLLLNIRKPSIISK